MPRMCDRSARPFRRRLRFCGFSFYLTSCHSGYICIGAPTMFRRLLPIGLLLATSFAAAREKAENWLQVTSPHFIVVTNASEKQGRRTADQFERMRSVFHAAFPKL